MNKVVETSLKPRKEWVTPEMKKVDIEQITANGTVTNNDGPISGS